MAHDTFTAEYTVTGMTCGNCEKHVREEVEELTEAYGITGIAVSAPDNHLAVTTQAAPADAAAFDAAILAAVDEAGYTATRK